MSDSNPNQSEELVRFSRRGMSAMLIFVIVLGATAVAMTLSPEGAASRVVGSAPWIFPIAIIILAAALRAPLRGRRWDPRSREAQTILNDELRQASLSRASRAALIVVLVAQIPLGLLFGMALQLPAFRATLAMAETTISLGMATLIGLFLFFDRE